MALEIYGCYGELGKLYRSYLRSDQVEPKEFTSGNKLVIEFGLLRRTASSGVSLRSSIFERQLAAGYSLAIGLYDSARSQLTYANSFTDLDEYTKTGVLLFNTSQITTALTSATEAACTLEINVTDSSGNVTTVYRGAWTIKKALITPASVEPTPGETAATQEWVKATCVPRDGTDTNNPCDSIYMLTADGRKVVLQIDANNQPKVVAFE